MARNRVFSAVAPVLWNSLPSGSLENFWWSVRTFLFQKPSEAGKVFLEVCLLTLFVLLFIISWCLLLVGFSTLYYICLLNWRLIYHLSYCHLWTAHRSFSLLQCLLILQVCHSSLLLVRWAFVGTRQGAGRSGQKGFLAWLTCLLSPKALYLCQISEDEIVPEFYKLLFLSVERFQSWE